MERPRYETGSNRADETQIASFIEAATGTTALKLEGMYIEYGDMAFERAGRIVSFCEIKRRNMRWGQYPDIVLAVHKWMKGEEIARSTGVPWIFAIGVDGADGLEVYGLRINPGESPARDRGYAIRNGGRTKNTRDQWDVEPVVHLPCSDFFRF